MMAHKTGGGWEYGKENRAANCGFPDFDRTAGSFSLHRLAPAGVAVFTRDFGKQGTGRGTGPTGTDGRRAV